MFELCPHCCYEGVHLEWGSDRVCLYCGWRGYQGNPLPYVNEIARRSYDRRKVGAVSEMRQEVSEGQ